MTKAAFGDIPVIGAVVLTVGLLTFVYSTLLGWSYYGEKAAEYLLGSRAIKPYRWLWVAVVMLGLTLIATVFYVRMSRREEVGEL